MKSLRDNKTALKGYFAIVSQHGLNLKSVSFLMIHNLLGRKSNLKESRFSFR